MVVGFHVSVLFIIKTNHCIKMYPLQLTEKTRAALNKQVSQKIAAAMPVRAADKQAPAQYIRCIWITQFLNQVSHFQVNCWLICVLFLLPENSDMLTIVVYCLESRQ